MAVNNTIIDLDISYGRLYITQTAESGGSVDVYDFIEKDLVITIN